MDKHPAWTRAYYESMAASAQHNFQITNTAERLTAIMHADARDEYTFRIVLPSRPAFTAAEMDELATKAADAALAAYTYSYNVAKMSFDDQHANRIAVGQSRYLELIRARLAACADDGSGVMDGVQLAWAVVIFYVYDRLYGVQTPLLTAAREETCRRIGTREGCVNFAIPTDYFHDIEDALDESDGCLDRFVSFEPLEARGSFITPVRD